MSQSVDLGGALNELALFAGAGGGILGGHLLGWRTVCAVEFDAFCARRLMQRQNEGHLPPFPVWDDVRTFDGRPWRGIVDVVSGGFPCQDISVAGRGAGIGGERSGLWSEMARIIGEVRPSFAFVENSPRLSVLGLYRVLGDLAELGFDAEWDVVSAKDAGANHLRKRMWVVAYTRHPEPPRRIQSPQGVERSALPFAPPRGGDVADSDRSTRERDASGVSETQAGELRAGELNGNCVERPSASGSRIGTGDGGWWLSEPRLDRVVDGVAYRVDRIRAIGNGQVPAVVRLAWETLTGTCGVNPHVLNHAGAELSPTGAELQATPVAVPQNPSEPVPGLSKEDV